MRCEDYTVGWICAILTEYVAACELLDEEHHPLPIRSQHDNNVYTLGRVGDHNVVIATLPKGEYGIASAAAVAKDMLHSFTGVRIGLMVGIGGGAPTSKQDIRLGDVVVSSPSGRFGGVLHYDLGRAAQDKDFEIQGSLNAPPTVLLTALSKLEATHVRKGHRIAESILAITQRNPRLKKNYECPGKEVDRLFEASYVHATGGQTCDVCCSLTAPPLIERRSRELDEDSPAIHYGLIASGHKLMKDAKIRDKLANEYGVLCFETEAAALMDNFPCVVIRGICDYSDTHKNDVWQCYAAVVAASYAKELLNSMHSRQVKEIPSAAHETKKLDGNPVSLIPFPRNRNFVSRDEAFGQLIEQLPYHASETAGIWGLGGCGKTQLALEYAYRRQENTSCSVFWVDGKSEARFSQSYGDIARKVGLSLESKAEDLWMAVKEWIEEQDNWLLVLDNVSDLGIYRKHNTCTSSSSELIRFIPKPQMGRRGAILWTARDGAILNLLIAVDQGLELGVMTVQESCSLLQKLCGQASTGIYSENEENLVQLSDRLPLAIAQVAAYIRKTKMSIQQYIALFNDSEDVQSDLLHLGFPDIYRSGFPNSVTEAWDDSMKQIRVETGLAHNILNTAAFFDNQGIPFGLFAAAANWPKAEIFRAAGRLVEHSFLKIQKTDADGLPIYEQHRLVQLATRNYLTVAEVNVYSIRALRLVAEVFPDGSYETWNTCKQYLPHSRKVLSWFENDESLNIVIENDEFQSVARLLAHTAMYYWTQGCYDEAEHFEVKLVDTQKSVLGNKHADTIGAMANLASTWWMQNCPDEAEYLQNEVLSMQKSVLGKKHPNTVVAMANLASIWWQQGRSDKAEKLQLEVLELQKTVLGEAHHHTILAMANLASIWWQQGRSYKAEDLDIETLSLLQAVLGESHPHTILAMSNLASTWWHQGSLGKAEDLDIEVLKLQKRVLGETHPDTVGAMRNLAITWYEQGRLDEAEELEGEIAELRKGGVAGESDLDPLRDLAASDRFSWHGFASDQNTWKPDDSLLARIPALAEAAFNNESMRLVRSRGIPPKSI